MAQPPVEADGFDHVNIFYDLSATYLSTGQPAQTQPGQTYTITVTYQQDDVPSDVDEADLALYYWNGTAWVKEPSSVVDVAANRLTATSNHFSLWAALAESSSDELMEKLFLPLIIKP